MSRLHTRADASSSQATGIPPVTAYLSLGSNLGDRRRMLVEALTRLEGHAGIEFDRVEDTAALYETDPVGEVSDQPAFLNAAARIRTVLEPLELLRVTQHIESGLGRVRQRPGDARVIDIDLLLYANAVVNTDALVVPHAAMLDRRFVLEPLCDLAPDVSVPGSSSVREATLVARTTHAEQRVRRVEEAGWAGRDALHR